MWSAFDRSAKGLQTREFQRPDASFAVNDIMAMGCADALRRDVFKLRIPEACQCWQVFDAFRPRGSWLPYQLTTIDKPM